MCKEGNTFSVKLGPMSGFSGGAKVFFYTGVNNKIIKAAVCFFCEEQLYRSTVADPGFPTRECQPHRGVPTYYSAKFYWNQHENERN